MAFVHILSLTQWQTENHSKSQHHSQHYRDNEGFLRRSSPNEYLASAVGILGKLSNIQSDHN